MSKRKKRAEQGPVEMSMSAFSATEQTGLIPADMGFDNSAENYNEVYDYLPKDSFVGRAEKPSHPHKKSDKKS